MKQTLLTLFLILTFQLGFGQSNLKTFDFLIGNWQGVETGVAGNGIGFRIYKYELGGNYIFVENQSTFPKSKKKTNW